MSASRVAALIRVIDNVEPPCLDAAIEEVDRFQDMVQAELSL